jgi:hypothetical protein
MRVSVSIILTLSIVTVSMLDSTRAYASGSHHGFGYGIHHGYGSHFGFGFVNSHYPYSYSYPYFSSAYVASAQQPVPIVVYRRRAQYTPHEKSAYCRKYMKKIVVDGKNVRAYGTACLQEEGSWRIVN